MEILFIAIISICISGTNCNNASEFVKHISEPFAIEKTLLKSDRAQDFMLVCNEQIDILRSNLTEEQLQRPKNILCTRKDVYDKAHPTE